MRTIKVSLFVRYIDIATGKYESKIHQQEQVDSIDYIKGTKICRN